MARSGLDGFGMRAWPGETLVFLFLVVAMVVVVAAVTLAVVGGGDGAGGALPEAAPEQLVDPLPATRPVGRADIEALRLPMAPRGYRMGDVDDVLGRLGAELAERDARIAELEAALAGVQAGAIGGAGLFGDAPFENTLPKDAPSKDAPASGDEPRS